ncbi:MAG: hypothetical protein ABJ118_16850, partial [Luteolibacter sp.]
FGKTGLPVFSAPSASINSAAIFHTSPTGAISLNIYLTDTNPAAGEKYQGGLIVPFSQDLGTAISLAAVNVFVPDPTGTHLFENGKWSLLPTWTLTSVAENLPLSTPFATARILELRIGESPPADFAIWRSASFPDPDDLADSLISGPLATPFGDGIANLLRYAFGVEPGSPALPNLPTPAASGNHHGIKFPFDSGRDDLIIKVQATDNPGNWSAATILFDSSTDFPPPADMDGFITILDPTIPSGSRFYRVMVTQK